MNSDLVEIVGELKRRLGLAKQRVREARDEETRLEAAIAALEGSDIKVVASEEPSDSGPECSEMVLEAARYFDKQYRSDGISPVFDYANLREHAEKLYGKAKAEFIRRGIYNSVKTLVGRGHFRKVPNGYELTCPEAVAA